MKRGDTKIAIKGNIEKGEDIIEYLETLGGDNSYMGATGTIVESYYFIDSDGDINWIDAEEEEMEDLERDGYFFVDRVPTIKTNFELWTY